MNHWFDLNSNEEPINNTNYINDKELRITNDELVLIKNVLRILTQDLISSENN